MSHPTNEGHYQDMLIEVDAVIKLIEGKIEMDHYEEFGVSCEMSVLMDSIFGH